MRPRFRSSGQLETYWTRTRVVFGKRRFKLVSNNFTNMTRAFRKYKSAVLAGFLVFTLAAYQQLPILVALAEEVSSSDSTQQESENEEKTDEEKSEEEKTDDGENEDGGEEKDKDKDDQKDTQEEEIKAVENEKSSVEEETADGEGEEDSADAENIETKEDGAADGETESGETAGGKESGFGENQPEGISVENTNEAQILDNVEAAANTGENSAGADDIAVDEYANNDADADEPVEAAEGMADDLEQITVETGEADAAVETGDAFSGAAVINEVNTNIVSENKEEIIENIYGEYRGDIDLLFLFSDLLEKTREKETNVSKEETRIILENINEADVENTVTAAASTGDNIVVADGTLARAEIETGDAAATASAVNIVNTNIFGENWLLAVINIFGSWTGDLIVPSPEALTVPMAREIAAAEIVNENVAEAVNNVLASADTGHNFVGAYTDADSMDPDADKADSIATGDATAEADARTIVNTNIVKNNWFFLMINDMGDWVGRVIGWNDDPEEHETFEYDFSEEEGRNPESLILSIRNQNVARVKNTVEASANTGNNSIVANSADSSEASNASVKTGDAFARAGVFNLINTNIVGDNWFFAIVNNFGFWRGNAVFASPDDGMGGEEIFPEEESETVETVHYDYDYHDEDSSARTSRVYDYGEYSYALSVQRDSDHAEEARPGEIVKNSLIVENQSDAWVGNVTVFDAVKDGSGREVGQFHWPIGNLNSGDKILIEYEIEIKNTGQKETYNYTAEAAGTRSGSGEVRSPKAIGFLNILGFTANAQENVLGEQTPADRALPLWMWLAAVVAYYLAVNWSLFPKRRGFAWII
ncbi:MAG: hypothetical protein QG620_635 [Patescibacteria group bacterium]|nr:hypothetical protein [Patescibacteria group bacterium]